MQVGSHPRTTVVSRYDGHRSSTTRGLTRSQHTSLRLGSTTSNKPQLSFDTAIRTLEDSLLIDPDFDGIQFAELTESNNTPIYHGNNDDFSFETCTLNGFDADPLLSLHRTSGYVRHSFSPVNASASLALDTNASICVSDNM